MSESTKPKKKMGRPTKYCTEIAAKLLTRITEGESLRQITRDQDMPGHSTVYEWLLAKPDFADNYARARDEQADTLADEIVAIADETPETEPVFDKNGELVEMRLHSAYIQWQKNRVDARKWVASKLKPKKYGDRQIVAGDKDNPLQIDSNVDEKFAAMITNLELKLQSK